MWVSKSCESRFALFPGRFISYGWDTETINSSCARGRVHPTQPMPFKTKKTPQPYAFTASSLLSSCMLLEYGRPKARRHMVVPRSVNIFSPLKDIRTKIARLHCEGNGHPFSFEQRFSFESLERDSISRIDRCQESRVGLDPTFRPYIYNGRGGGGSGGGGGTSVS